MAEMAVRCMYMAFLFLGLLKEADGGGGGRGGHREWGWVTIIQIVFCSVFWLGFSPHPTHPLPITQAAGHNKHFLWGYC